MKTNTKTAIPYQNLSTAQINALREALEKYTKDFPVTDSDIDDWSDWATGQELGKSLKQLNKLYKDGYDKAYYLKGLDVLKVFYPEIDSPLFKAMSESEDV